jgi:uncharacterized protein (UPF0179 family)
MANARLINNIVRAIKAAQNDVTTLADPTTDLQNALKTAKDLKEILAGVDNTIYVYDCDNSECPFKTKCHQEIPFMLTDLTICLDSCQTGDAHFNLTATRI